MTRAVNAKRGPAQTQPSLAEIITETVRMLVARDRATWDQVSAGSGIPRSSFAKRLNGEIEWRAGEIQALADYFQVTPGFLVSGFRPNRPTANSQNDSSRSKGESEKDTRALAELDKQFPRPVPSHRSMSPAFSEKRSDKHNGPGRGQEAGRGPRRDSSNLPRRNAA